MTEELRKKIEKEIRATKAIWNNNSEHIKLTESLIRQMFKVRHEVNTIRDEKGMPIPGTGRLITVEEKKQIIDFMMENNYPLTITIYNLLLRGYINGELTIEEKKTNKL